MEKIDNEKIIEAIVKISENCEVFYDRCGFHVGDFMLSSEHRVFFKNVLITYLTYDEEQKLRNMLIEIDNKKNEIKKVELYQEILNILK